jgi:hypothetical protein
MLSTKRLDLIPEIEDIKKVSKSLAVLTVIFKDNLHYYWEENNKARTGMQNEQGEEYFILFNEYGAIIKGYSTESDMLLREKVWPGLIDKVPKEFEDVFNDDFYFAGCSTLITFCFWKKYSDFTWNKGNFEYPGNSDRDYDGSEDCLSYLFMTPEEYVIFAKDNYFSFNKINGKYSIWYEEFSDVIKPPVEVGKNIIDLESVKYIYEHKPLTDNIVKSINPYISLDEIKEKITSIGYPVIIN